LSVKPDKTGRPDAERRINGVSWRFKENFEQSPLFKPLSQRGAGWKPDPNDRRANKRRRWSLVLSKPGDSVFLKYFLPRNPLELIKYLFKPTRASVEWRNTQALASIGVPVPRLVALGERRRLKVWSQSFLVSESLSGAPTLLDWSESHADDPRNLALGRCLAGHVANMHNHGMFHRDLHGDNVLVREQGDTLSLCFLDFYELQQLERPVNKFCVEDLGRLNGFIQATSYQRIRFVYDYLRVRKIDLSEARDWIRAIDANTRGLWDYYDAKGVNYRRY
jgi:tRNA A-37 threonylcarbamoyl transferase component Bud32